MFSTGKNIRREKKSTRCFGGRRLVVKEKFGLFTSDDLVNTDKTERDKDRKSRRRDTATVLGDIRAPLIIGGVFLTLRVARCKPSA